MNSEQWPDPCVLVIKLSLTYMRALLWFPGILYRETEKPDQ